MGTESRIFHTGKIQVQDNQRESVAGITTEYPYVMHHSDFDRESIPWHWHEEVEFGYVLAGELEVVTVERKYHFSAHQGYFMNGNILSSMHKQPERGRQNCRPTFFIRCFWEDTFRAFLRQNT